MRICMFAKGLPIHNGAGGMEKHTEDLAEGLRRRGHDVTIITTHHPRHSAYWCLGNNYYIRESRPLHYSSEFFRKTHDLFVKLHTEEPFDIVHSQSIAGYGVAKYCQQNGIPFVMTVHGIPYNNVIGAIKTRSLKLLGGAIINYVNNLPKLTKCVALSDRIAVVSNELLSDCKRDYPSEEDKMLVIPNGVDTDFFRPLDASALRTEVGIKETEKVIVTVGRVQKEKGIQRLIKILPDLPGEDTIIVIVGEGPYLPTLKKEAQYSAIDKDVARSGHIFFHDVATLKKMAGHLVSNKVVFSGRVPDDELPLYYNLADVVAFPTLRIEGMPLVLLEAMACGKVVVASEIGGIPSVITNYENGLLCDPFNDAKLTGAIHAALAIARENFGYHKNLLGGPARNTILNKFSLDTMLDRYVALYKDAEEIECIVR